MNPKPGKPYKAGRYLVAERYKLRGHVVQMKFGRRVLAELPISVAGKQTFRDTEAFTNMRNQADEFHQKGWSPPPPPKKKKATAEFQDLPALASFFAKTPKFLKPVRHPESAPMF